MSRRVVVPVSVLLLVLIAAVGCGRDPGTDAQVSSGGAATSSTTSTTTKGKPTTTKKGGGKTPGSTAKGPGTTAKPVASAKDADPQFCNWVKLQQNVSKDASRPFESYFAELMTATADVRDHVPQEVAADHATIEKGLERVKPAVERGDVSSEAKFSQWLTQNDPELFNKVGTSIQHIATYAKAHC